MRTSLIIKLATVATLAVLPTVAPEAASASVKLPLPFTARVSGSAQLTSATTGTFSGSGISVPMGLIGNAGNVVAYFDQPSSTCPHGFHSVNTETFTDARGDSLSLRSSDATCPVGPQAPTQFRGTGHWVVTGGTGRYHGATGHGTYSGFADFGHGFRFTFTGSIS